jgi:hypothetical protein
MTDYFHNILHYVESSSYGKHRLGLHFQIVSVRLCEGISKHQQFKKKSIITGVNTVHTSV